MQLPNDDFNFQLYDDDEFDLNEHVFKRISIMFTSYCEDIEKETQNFLQFKNVKKLETDKTFDILDEHGDYVKSIKQSKIISVKLEY